MVLTDMDRAALNLYWRPSEYHEGPCFGPLSFFDMLTGECPWCGAPVVAGAGITPERAAEMLIELQVRRVELGAKP